ncbi:MAG: HAD family hydrolase [Mobiluncus sp.]|nr:HAD family hydrolase [Mobiluncus sp.]
MTFNGSYCFDRNGEVLFSQPIRPADARRVIENATNLGKPICAATTNQMVANGSEPDLDTYFAFGGFDVPISADFQGIVESEPVFQLMCAAQEPEYADLTRGAAGVKIMAWWERAVDIIPATSGKDLGVKAILAALGLEPEQAMAFGDGHNDIEMLRAVGWGVAMGNGRDEVKAAADDVAQSVADEGIDWYLRENHLI